MSSFGTSASKLKIVFRVHFVDLFRRCRWISRSFSYLSLIGEVGITSGRVRGSGFGCSGSGSECMIRVRFESVMNDVIY